MNRNGKIALLAACGAVASLSNVASAQPSVIAVSGATLLENYLSREASTRDFIDVDGDKNAGSLPSLCRPALPEQLAPPGLPAGCTQDASGWTANPRWAVLYTAVGSTRGLQELIDNGRTYNNGLSGETAPAAGRPTPLLPTLVENVCIDMDVRSSAFFNGTRYITGGNFVNTIANLRNPGGAPIRTKTDGSFKAVFSFPDDVSSQDTTVGNSNDCITVDAGVTIDAAILDVPVRYAVRQSGASISANRKPGEVGYGDNTKFALNKDGTTSTRNNKLASLTPTTGCTVSPASTTAANINTASPDANTIFDTPLFFAPIAPITNFGTGVSQINISELRQLFATGRLPSGENLVAVTRDSGSGTRNGWDNSLGNDPSWGIGDNVGIVNNSIDNDRAGVNFLPVNKNGNPRVEQTVYNSRLAIGYVGPERGVSNSSPDIQWLAQGYAEVVSVVNDSYGGTLPQRPTCAAIGQNSTGNSWVIGGPASFGTFGDPRSAPADKGGLGWMEPYCDVGADGIAGTADSGEGDNLFTLGEPFRDFNGNAVRDAVEVRPGVLNPAMRNVEAAAFINNITRAIDQFEAGFIDPFTPGQLAAQNFFLTGAQNRLQDPNNPANLIPNPGFSPSLQTFILGSGAVCNNPLYTAFGNAVAPSNPVNSRAGKVPARRPGVYSDAIVNPVSATNGNYITESGATLDQDGDLSTTGGRDNLPLRNLISGDFNGDGLRTVADASDLVGAWRKRTAGATWSAPNGSGALASLGTATGQGVSGGDFSIEIVGDFNVDGSFDSADLRYWADGLAITGGLLDRKAGFTALDNALNAQTSGADNNLFNTTLSTGKVYQPGDSRGDVVNAAGRTTPGFQPLGEGTVNALDVDYVYNQFKGVTGITGAANWSDFSEAILFDLSADITGDLQVDQADIDELVKGILGTCYGDVNLDGAVNSLDQAIIQASIATPPATPTWSNGDINGDNLVNAADLALYCPADVNCSGTVTVQDIFDFLALYFNASPKADINGSGSVTVQDIFDFLAAYFSGC